MDFDHRLWHFIIDNYFYRLIIRQLIIELKA